MKTSQVEKIKISKMRLTFYIMLVTFLSVIIEVITKLENKMLESEFWRPAAIVLFFLIIFILYEFVSKWSTSSNIIKGLEKQIDERSKLDIAVQQTNRKQSKTTR